MATPRKTTAPRTPRKTAAKAAPPMVDNEPVQIADVSSFKKPPAPVQLPSGNWVVIRRVGLRAFLVNGVIPNSLMAVVQQSMTDGVNHVDQETMMKEVLEDTSRLTDLMQMADAAAVYSMVEPRVYATPAEGEERDDTLLYADELSEADKMEIFTYATGGTIGLESFRS